MSQDTPNMDARIRVVYPKPEQEIYEDSTFLMGSVTACPPGTHLFLDYGTDTGQHDIEIPLSTHGFFAYKIPTHAGMNPIRLALRLNSATPPMAQELFALHGVAPFSVLPASPLAVHEETVQPASDCWSMESDTLVVACSASEGVQVLLDIPGFLKEFIPLEPAPTSSPLVDNREAIFAQLHWTRQRIPTQGYYRAQVPVKTLLHAADRTHLEHDLPNLPLVLLLRHEGQVLKYPLAGKLSLLTKPRRATVTVDRAVSRTAPVDGARLTPQRQNTKVLIDGLREDWARVRLSADEAFYLPMDQLSFGATSDLYVSGGKDALMSLMSIRTEPVVQNAQSGTSASIVCLAFTAPEPSQLAQACPIQVEVLPSAEMNRLQLRLYGVCSRCDFIHYPPGDNVVRQIHWRPVAENVLELWIDTQQPISGYDYAWEAGQWKITVKTLPQQVQDIRVLIDPGHGGAETGATGLNGLPEKDLNLTVSRMLRDALLPMGFQVMMTRDTDEDVSLQARGECVEETQADIVLSIHHNALPDGRDPLQAQGASCFYYQSFAKTLAQNLLSGLTNNRGTQFNVPNYGLFYDSLYMTRIHQATAVLVEIGFFTNPDEFERLIDQAFQREAAQRLASALRRYCLPSLAH